MFSKSLFNVSITENKGWSGFISKSSAVSLFLFISCFLLVTCFAPAHAEKLPGGVTSRITKINQYMTKVEKALENNRADSNNLEWAQSTLEEIKKQYPANANADEVNAAEERINKGAAAIEKLKSDQTAEKDQKAKGEKVTEEIAVQWADKLDLYTADTKEGSKGNYGAPMSEVAPIVALAPQYKEAKAVYAEFLATGIDKESHWKLRQAEYDIKVAINNYQSSVERVVMDVEDKVIDAYKWQAQQKTLPAPILLQKDRLPALREAVASIRLLLPTDNTRMIALNTSLTELEKVFTDVENIVLKNRKMKPDIYKGVDQAALKSLASSIVLKTDANAKILRTHIINANWTTESVEEWTDTTQTALQHRVTKGINVQVALKIGNDCFLYTLFINQDTIGGVKRPLTGHVMFKDKFLAENLPK